MSHRDNIVRIKAVFNALGTLRKDVVFVGGSTVSLYADRIAEEVRPTNDVDILIEIWTHREYAEIEEQLRKMGFRNDMTSKVACRYTIGDTTVDVMATGEEVLGFSNKWYPAGYKNSIEHAIDNQHLIRIFSAPFFIATKLEAFKSPTRKDNNDGRYSSDFEDIIYILENRFNIWQELREAPAELKSYLVSEFARLQSSPLFADWIDAHAGYGSPPPSYYIRDQLKKFTEPV